METRSEVFGIIPRRVLKPLVALGPAELAVWIALATFADADGSSAHPCQATIEAETGLSRRTVQRALARLEQAGAILRAGYRARGVVTWCVVLDFVTPSSELDQKRHGWRTCATHDARQGWRSTSATRDASPASYVTPPPASHVAHNQTLLPDPGPDHSPLGDFALAPSPVNSPAGSAKIEEVRPPTPVRAAPAVAHQTAPQRTQPAREVSRGTQDSAAGDRPAESPAARLRLAPPPPADPARAPTDVEFGERVTTEVQDLIEDGVGSHLGALSRWSVLESLVRDYRRRWPCSWPSDWRMAAQIPSLCGPIRDRAAWIWTHVGGYAREGWKPENRDGSEREWHAQLLAGNLGEALRSKQIESSYRGENILRKETHKGKAAMKGFKRMLQKDPELGGMIEETVSTIARSERAFQTKPLEIP